MNLRASVLLSVVLIFGAVGCASTMDLTKKENSVCEVHNEVMTIEVIDCAPGGFSGYRPEYDTARRKQFPHHGRLRFSEDHAFMPASRLRTHVCGECTRVHDQWIGDNTGK